MTSVAIAVLLVSTAPVFVAIVARFVTGERLNSVGWIGIAMAMGGTIVIGGADFADSSVWGSVLALIGGATGGWYVLAGQIARRALGILEYAVIAYSDGCGVIAAVLHRHGGCTVGLRGPDLVGDRGADRRPTTSGPHVHQLRPVGHRCNDGVCHDHGRAGDRDRTGLLSCSTRFRRRSSWPATVLILAGIYMVSTARHEATPICE